VEKNLRREEKFEKEKFLSKKKGKKKESISPYRESLF